MGGLLFAVLLAQAPAARVRVEVEAQGTPCSAELVRAALRARRPDSVAEEGAPDALVARVAREGARWSLAVSDGAAQVLLRRELPAPGAECAGLADTAALMIDRFLRELPEGSAAEPLPLPRRPVGPPPAVPAAGPIAPPAPPVLAPPPPSPAHLAAHLAAFLGATVALGRLGGSASPGLGAAVVFARGPWRLGVAADDFLAESKPVAAADPGAGRLSLSALSLKLRGARAFAAGPGRALAEASAGGDLLWAAARGPRVFHPASAFEMAPALGLGAGYELPLPRGFELALRVDGRFLPDPAAFAVEGFDVAKARRWDGALSLALGRAIF